MPAHQTFAAVGSRLTSAGLKLTATQWRANRLVDALAQKATEHATWARASSALLRSARLAVRHAAALLGVVTHAANHHVVEVVDEAGKVTHNTLRDAMEPPAGKKRAQPRAAKVQEQWEEAKSNTLDAKALPLRTAREA